jgi:hypothetical protein
VRAGVEKATPVLRELLQRSCGEPTVVECIEVRRPAKPSQAKPYRVVVAVGRCMMVTARVRAGPEARGGLGPSGG